MFCECLQTLQAVGSGTGQGSDPFAQNTRHELAETELVLVSDAALIVGAFANRLGLVDGAQRPEESQATLASRAFAGNYPLDGASKRSVP